MTPLKGFRLVTNTVIIRWGSIHFVPVDKVLVIEDSLEHFIGFFSCCEVKRLAVVSSLVGQGDDISVSEVGISDVISVFIKNLAEASAVGIVEEKAFHLNPILCMIKQVRILPQGGFSFIGSKQCLFHDLVPFFSGWWICLLGFTMDIIALNGWFVKHYFHHIHIII
jgi:hypothetical protein